MSKKERNLEQENAVPKQKNKFFKIFITFATMALSILVYSFIFGFWFAAGFIVMVLIHEMGHVIALRRKGYPMSAPIFIPLLGAVIFTPNLKDLDEEAYVGFGGPFLGGLAALALFGIWAVLPQKIELLLLISFMAAFLNLFNMIPIRPLDGGRIVHIVGSWFEWVGFVALFCLTLFNKQPVFLLIWIIVIQNSNFNPVLKYYANLLCLIGMSILMVLGYSKQPLIFNYLYLYISTFLVMLSYKSMKFYALEENKKTVEKRIEAPLGKRIKWLVLYVLLFVALSALMFIQFSYLLPAIQKQ